MPIFFDIKPIVPVGAYINLKAGKERYALAAEATIRNAMNSCLVSTAKDRSTLFRLISDARLGARFTVNKLSHRIRNGDRRHLSGNERVPSNFTSVYDVLEFPNTFEGNWVHNFIVFNSKVNGKIILTQDDMRKFMGNPQEMSMRLFLSTQKMGQELLEDKAICRHGRYETLSRASFY